MGQPPKKVPIRSDECLTPLVVLKFPRFQFKGKSEYTFIKNMFASSDQGRTTRTKIQKIICSYLTIGKKIKVHRCGEPQKTLQYNAYPIEGQAVPTINLPSVVCESLYNQTVAISPNRHTLECEREPTGQKSSIALCRCGL